MGKDIIAIVGATGAQGGGLARAILSDKDGRFQVRAITRTPGSERARALAALGAEVVVADLDDRASLVNAFAGAYGAFCVTNFWEHFSPARETLQASNMAHAAKEARLAHVVWSTLEDTRKLATPDDPRVPTLMGNYKVPHTDAKADADAVFRELVPTTFLLASFYWENFLTMGPQRDPEGQLALMLPIGDTKLAGIATEDIGRSALGIFRRGRDLIGKRIGVASEMLTGAQLAAGLSRGLGEPVRWAPPSIDAFRAMMRYAPVEALGRSTGFSAADDTANMFQLLIDHEPFFLASHDPGLTRALNPELQSFDTWVTRTFPRGGDAK